MYTETIMRKVEADGELTSFNAVNMHGKEIKELRYADDTVLFAQTPEGLRRLLQSVKTHSESSGLYLNAKKDKDHGPRQKPNNNNRCGRRATRKGK